MNVLHRCLDRLVTHNLLNRRDRSAVVHCSRSERVPEIVEMQVRNSRFSTGSVPRVFDARVVEAALLGRHNKPSSACKCPLAPIKRNEFNRAEGFCGRDMEDIETTGAGRCQMEFTRPGRSAKCSRPLNRRSYQSRAPQVALQIRPSSRNIGCRQ